MELVFHQLLLARLGGLVLFKLAANDGGAVNRVANVGETDFVGRVPVFDLGLHRDGQLVEKLASGRPTRLLLRFAGGCSCVLLLLLLLLLVIYGA